MNPTTGIWPGTGIAQNYIDQIVGKIVSFELEGKAGLAEHLKRSPIPRYEELFPVNEQNQERVQRLDEIIEAINLMTDPDKFAEKYFKEMVNEYLLLVRGENYFKYISLVLGKDPKFYEDV